MESIYIGRGMQEKYTEIYNWEWGKEVMKENKKAVAKELKKMPEE